jgi:hypothetical protein
MKLSQICPFDTVGARCVRALVVFICISVTYLQPGYCPTGQASCVMEDMEDSFSMGVACLIACDVPVQAKDVAAPMFARLITHAERPVSANKSGGYIQPDVPPHEP